MDFKPIIFIFITSIFFITACTQLSNRPVDTASLVKSMLYTQRHLIEVIYNSQVTGNIKRKMLLEKSHCDLIDRKVVYANQAINCPISDLNSRACIALFHQCIGLCKSYRENCIHCETQTIHCLSSKEIDIAKK